MKSRIGIDARMARHTGIGTYITGLIEGFREIPKPAFAEMTLFGNPTNLEPFASSFQTESFDSAIYSIPEQIDYGRLIKPFHLWHSPHYNVPFLKPKAKLVVTVHDLIHWIFRKEYLSPLQRLYAGVMFRKTVENADRIIAVSQKTKEDLMKHFAANPTKITVIYEGVSQDFSRTQNRAPFETVKKKYGLPDRFFLYVGMIKPHKNIVWLTDLFRQMVRDQKTQCGLVIVGKKDEKYQRGVEMLASLKNEDCIFHIPYAEKQALIALYQNCLALIHPSLYEGFGLTPLEAMACGAPVIAVRAGSIPEILGTNACLVENDAPEMMKAIIQMEKDNTLRTDLIEKGLAHAARFRWKETAERTLAVYQKVLAA